MPAFVGEALIYHTACIAHAARQNLTQVTPGMDEPYRHRYKAYLDALWSATGPSLWPLLEFNKQSCGAFSCEQRSIILPKVVPYIHPSQYILAEDMMAHEFTHLDQFYPGELKLFLPSFERVLERVDQIILTSRDRGHFAPIDEFIERQTAQVVDAKFAFWRILGEVFRPLADMMQGSPIHPSYFYDVDVFSDELVVIARGQRFHGYEGKEGGLVGAAVERAKQEGVFEKPKAGLDPDGVQTVLENVVASAEAVYPGLYRNLRTEKPRHAYPVISQSSVHKLLVARAMLMKMRTRPNFETATPILVRTLQAWKAELLKIEQHVLPVVVEHEAHIVSALVTAKVGDRVETTVINEFPGEAVAIPPPLNDPGEIDELLSGATDKSRKFIAEGKRLLARTFKLQFDEASPALP